MSGAFNPDLEGGNLPEQVMHDVGRGFAYILGPQEGNEEVYDQANVLSYADEMATNDVEVIFDCYVRIGIRLIKRPIIGVGREARP